MLPLFTTSYFEIITSFSIVRQKTKIISDMRVNFFEGLKKKDHGAFAPHEQMNNFP